VISWLRCALSSLFWVSWIIFHLSRNNSLISIECDQVQTEWRCSWSERSRMIRIPQCEGTMEKIFCLFERANNSCVYCLPFPLKQWFCTAFKWTSVFVGESFDDDPLKLWSADQTSWGYIIVRGETADAEIVCYEPIILGLILKNLRNLQKHSTKQQLRYEIFKGSSSPSIGGKPNNLAKWRNISFSH
jgi:hypothetical protein